MNAVRIEWLDHCSAPENEWQSLDDVKNLEPELVTSYGFVVRETDDFITIAASRGQGNESFLGDLCIVKSCIVNRKNIK